MSGSNLRRFVVLGFALCLWLLPLTKADAAPRESYAGETIGSQIQQFGRTLLQAVRGFVPGLPTQDTTTVSGPGVTDGVGIDPHGGIPGKP
jgi:hypothetical protein